MIPVPGPEPDEQKQRRGVPSIPVVIPAYRPAPVLVSLSRELKSLGFAHLVVVDDGSGSAFQTIFQACAELPGVRVLKHAINLGKGAALKTGINFALCEFPEAPAVITMDADGQHRPQDVARVADAFLSRSLPALTLGSRTFSTTVPLRSRFGNTVTRLAVRSLVGKRLRDTQTGLRCIPRDLAADSLRLRASGYDFELDMLISASRRQVSIQEVEIATIYEPGNPSSHFNPLLDSMKIYFVLLRFSSISLLTAVLDNLLFISAFALGAQIFTAQFIGRCAGVAFNYFAVRRAVFLAPRKHSIAMPRFIALATVSGIASYACIRLLVETLKLPVIEAKLLAESVLFFANFAIQREWVFAPSEEQGDGASEALAREPRTIESAETVGENVFPKKGSNLRSLTVWLAVCASICIVSFGVWHTVSFRHPRGIMDVTGWSHLGWNRFRTWLELFGGLAVVGSILLRRWFFLAIFLASLCLIAALLGPVSVFSVLAFLLAWASLGRRLFGSTCPPPLALLAGMTIWTCVFALVKTLPIHYWTVYTGLLALILFWCRREATSLVKQGVSMLVLPRAGSASTYYAFAVVSFLALTHTAFAMLPDVGADPLAMHLAIAADFANHHAFTFDFHRIAWALMPINGDLAFSAVYMLGGEFAAHLLNVAMLLLSAAIIFALARRMVNATWAALLAALFMTTPLAQSVTSNSMVENFTAVTILGSFYAAMSYHEAPSRRLLLLCAILLGGSAEFKIGALGVSLLVFAMVATDAYRNWNRTGRKDTVVYGAAALLFLVLAIWPYVNSYLRTGSPTFPMYSPFFRSPILEINDARFKHPLSWRLPYDLTFTTHEYFEGRDHSFGFQYLLFLPVSLVLLPFARSVLARRVFILGFCAPLVIAAFLPNARYFYPAMPLMSLSGAVIWTATKRTDLGLHALFCLCIIAVLGLNMVYFNTGDWAPRADFVSWQSFTDAGRREYVHAAAPVREAVEVLNRTDRKGAVLFAQEQGIAGIIAPFHELSWHDYSFGREYIQCSSPSSLHRLLEKERVAHVLLRTSPELPIPPVLDTVLAACGVEEFRTAGYRSIRVLAHCRPPL